MRLAILLALVASPAAAVDLQKFQSPDQRTKSRAESNAASLSAAEVSTIAEGGASYSGSAVNFTFNQAGGGARYEIKRNNPDVYAAALAGGNPCAVSASGGGGGGGVGITLAYGWEGENCGIRNEMIVLDNIGQRKEAQVHGCLHLERVKATYEAMGKDCLGNPLPESGT